jgi:DNA-binding transcriptional ArsR family regulator
VYDFKLSASAQCVYFYLCTCADKDGFCFPGREKIHRETGLALSTISRSIKELKAKGLIDFAPRFQKTKSGTSRQTSNLYTILDLSRGGDKNASDKS